MSDDILLALIATAGVLLSALVSWITSRKVAVNEIQRLRFEAKRTYDAKLFEERLRCYPGIFFLLSNFIKEIEFGSITIDTIDSLLTEINDWDSRNAIILSPFSADACYEFRHYLRNLWQEGDQLKLSSREFLEELRLRAATMEFILRSDIGVYGIRSSEEGEYDPRVIDSQEKLEDMRRDFKRKAEAR